VDVLEPPQHLVQEKLVMLRREVVVRLDHLRTTADTTAGVSVQALLLLFLLFLFLLAVSAAASLSPAGATSPTTPPRTLPQRLTWCRSVSMSSNTT
jgi:hypothetical protein